MRSVIEENTAGGPVRDSAHSVTRSLPLWQRCSSVKHPSKRQAALAIPVGRRGHRFRLTIPRRNQRKKIPNHTSQ